MMLPNYRSHPGRLPQPERFNLGPNYRCNDLPALVEQARLAAQTMDRTTTFPAHPTLQRQQDRENLRWIRSCPDFAHEVYQFAEHWYEDEDVWDYFMDCQHMRPRYVLGLEAPRSRTPNYHPAMFMRDVTANLMRTAVGA